MLKKINGFGNTAEARKYLEAIEQRAAGAVLFREAAPAPAAAKPSAPQAPAL